MNGAFSRQDKDRLCFAFFLLFLIVPTAYFGLTHRHPPWTPRLFMHFYSTSSLFPYGIKYLPLHYLQVQTIENGPWTTLPEKEYFRMSSGFGYRTRFSRFTEIYFSVKDDPIIETAGDELAPWVRRRFQELHPEGPPPVSFRIVRGLYVVRTRAKLKRWTVPELGSLPPNYLQVLYTHPYRG